MKAYRRTSVVMMALLLAALASCDHNPFSRIKRISPAPPVVCATNGPGYYFFGYFGINPWSASEDKLLCLRVGFQDRVPEAADSAEICYVELASGRIVPVAKTAAWNFQQGAMLHWMPESPDSLIIYNDRRDGRFVSVVRNVYTGEARELPMPIAALSHGGKYAVSVDFAMNYRMRPGYGYAGGETGADPASEDPKSGGLFLLDTESGAAELIASYDRVDSLLGRPVDSLGNPMWFNHAVFNTDDSRIFFLARIMKRTPGWVTAGLTVGVDGSDLRCILPFTWGASHFDWKSPTEICVTTFYQGRIPGYVIVTDGREEYGLIGEGVLKRDGHMSFSPDRRWMVTDTYRDWRKRRSLYLVDLEKDRVYELGKFYSDPALDGEYRCDLHPRWNHDGTKICFDSIHEGTRRVYIVDVSSVVSR